MFRESLKESFEVRRRKSETSAQRRLKRTAESRNEFSFFKPERIFSLFENGVSCQKADQMLLIRRLKKIKTSKVWKENTKLNLAKKLTIS